MVWICLSNNNCLILLTNPERECPLESKPRRCVSTLMTGGRRQGELFDIPPRVGQFWRCTARSAVTWSRTLSYSASLSRLPDIPSSHGSVEGPPPSHPSLINKKNNTLVLSRPAVLTASGSMLYHRWRNLPWNWPCFPGHQASIILENPDQISWWINSEWRVRNWRLSTEECLYWMKLW